MDGKLGRKIKVFGQRSTKNEGEYNSNNES